MAKNADFCQKLNNCLGELEKWSTWQNIILGQFLSLMLCIITILTHFMNKGVNGSMPTGQSFPHYMFLCIVYTTWLACRSGNNGLISVLKTRGWRYFLLCLIDVEANALFSVSHQFTTAASIQLLGCVAIPVSLVLTCLVLGVRYRMVHIIAVSICLLGVGCLVWIDVNDQPVTIGRNHLMGDMLCLGGAILATVVSVLQELSVKTTDIVEYLGMLGLFGSVISGVQMMFLEQETLLSVHWESPISLLILVIFSTLQFIYCSLTSLMVQNTGATALHLNSLSANYYTSILGTLFLGFKCHALTFLSYVIMMTGIFTFFIKNSPISRRHTHHHEQQPQIQNNMCDNIRHDAQMSMGSDGTELLSNIGALNFITNNTSMTQSVSMDTTFTSFYGSGYTFTNNTNTSNNR